MSTHTQNQSEIIEIYIHKEILKVGLYISLEVYEIKKDPSHL